MNVKQVKEQYSLQSLLALLGFRPDAKKSKGLDLWYISPFRPSERTPSFHLHAGKDFYKDFGDTEKGGDIIHFAQVYLKHQGKAHSVSDVLKWFDNLGGGVSVKLFNQKARVTKKQTTPKVETPYRLISEKNVEHTALLNTLRQRKINNVIASAYLKEIHFERLRDGKTLFGLGHQMRGGGYDIRGARGFKTTIGTKDITLVAGEQSSYKLDVIEGVMDFLTKLSLEEKSKPDNDTIILNSTNLYARAVELIKKGLYSEVRLWMDNDAAGQKFTNAILEQFKHYQDRPIIIYAMNSIYKDYKDLNLWHQNAPLTFERKKMALSAQGIVLDPHQENKIDKIVNQGP